MSLDVLADRIPMDKGNLSKIERGLLPYNQELLEKLADALQVETASLLMRDPSLPAAIWSIWDIASHAERLQIERVAEALVQKKRAI
jgi:transcriptional regulator with XRE-family HTH domain